MDAQTPRVCIKKKNKSLGYIVGKIYPTKHPGVWLRGWQSPVPFSLPGRAPCTGARVCVCTPRVQRGMVQHSPACTSREKWEGEGRVFRFYRQSFVLLLVLSFLGYSRQRGKKGVVREFGFILLFFLFYSRTSFNPRKTI